MSDAFHYLIQPGWNDSPASHWQSHWQHVLGASRVANHNWHRPQLDDWLQALDNAIAASPRPVIVIAHSLGCIALARYAASTRRSIAGALLVAPADVERTQAPAAIAGFAPITRQRLPFPSRVVASDDDPFCRLSRARAMANDWGSTWQVLNRAGHINVDSGHRQWEDGLSQLALLIESVQTPILAA